MTNIYFSDEEITVNDLYFICYMIERMARKLHQRNRYAAVGSLRCRKNKDCLSYLQLAESLVKEIACSFVSCCAKFAYWI